MVTAFRGEERRCASRGKGRAGPLAGVKVIETATYISGPFTGLILADLGAQVFKVEPPRGDPLRRFGRPTGPVSAFFVNCNRNKIRVSLDLKKANDRDTLLEMVSQADVFLANWRPDAAERLGITDDTLTEANSNLIRLYVTGFAAGGPYGSQPVFDSMIQALSGLSTFQGEADMPELVKTYLYDKVTGLLGAQSVVSALFNRTQTGEGERIDLTMLASAGYFNFPDMFSDSTFLDGEAGPTAKAIVGANRPLPASDGWLVVSPVSVGQIRRCGEATGTAARIDAVLATAGSDLTRAFLEVMAEQTPTKTVKEWLEIFVQHDVPAAPCLTSNQHLNDPQVVSENIYWIDRWDGLGDVRQVRFPATFSESSQEI